MGFLRMSERDSVRFGRGSSSVKFMLKFMHIELAWYLGPCSHRGRLPSRRMGVYGRMRQFEGASVYISGKVDLSNLAGD